MIVNHAGLPLYSQSYEKGLDCCSEDHHSVQKLEDKKQLFSGFITALSGMASEFDADLKQLSMGVWDIYLESKNDVKTILVSKSDTDPEKQTSYKQAIGVIMDRFIEEFDVEIKNFNGNIEKFRTFEHSLRDLDILEDGTISTPLCRACILELEQKIEK